MPQRKPQKSKRPRGETVLLTLPEDMKAWLLEHAKKQGASSPQEAVRRILADTRQREQAA